MLTFEEKCAILIKKGLPFYILPTEVFVMKNFTKITSVLLAVLLVVALLPSAAFAATTYQVYIPSYEHGTITASKTTGLSAGDKVTLTITPDAGYSLKGGEMYHTVAYGGTYLYYTYGSKTYYIGVPDGAETFTFTMPSASVFLVASFRETRQFDLSVSSLTITSTGYIYNSTSADFDGSYRITGTTSTNSIKVLSGNPIIYLHNVSACGTDDSYCAFSIEDTARANVILDEGTVNTLKSGKNCAGIQVAPKAALTISCGNNDAEHECGALCGTLTSVGGQYGAGIGGGYLLGNGSVTINGGVITASCEAPIDSSAYGAGIGGGNRGNGGYVTINGGVVTALAAGNKVDSYGAGIGGGAGASSTLITVNGGIVKADAGNYLSGHGAGIGGGSNGSGGIVIISGGRVSSIGGSVGGAGIGGGADGGTGVYMCGSGASVKIEGGTVEAVGGGYYGCGIGGGIGYATKFNGAPGSVSIAPSACVRPSEISFGGAIQAQPVSTLTGDDVFLTKVILPAAYNKEVKTITVSDKTYELKDVYTDAFGTLCLYLPEGAVVTAAATATATYSGRVTADKDPDDSTGTLKKTDIKIEKVAAPVVTPKSGLINASDRVTITTATAGATIYYTTDGTMPTRSSKKYTGPFAVTSDCIISAIAVKSGMTDSDLVFAVYTAYKPVTAVIGVPHEATTNTTLILTGLPYPHDAAAASSAVTWSVSPNNRLTGVTVFGNTFTAKYPGLATVRATVSFGVTLREDYYEDFVIMVKAPGQGDVTPIIVKQPVNASVPEGESATFTVTAVGSETFNYQWQRTVSSSYSSAWEDIAGATDQFYTTPALSISDSGRRYRCVVSNSAGTTITYPVTVSVDNDLVPVINEKVKIEDAVKGEEYRYVISADGEYPMFWTLIEGELPTGLKLTSDGVISGTPEELGTFTFTLRVINYYGSAVKRLSVTVKEKGEEPTEKPTEEPTKPVTPAEKPSAPVIVSQTGDISDLKVGDSAVLFVSATAEKGTVSYQWYRNGEAIEGATGQTLVIENVTSANDGDIYYALITSTLGGETSVIISAVKAMKVAIKNPPSCDD